MIRRALFLLLALAALARAENDPTAGLANFYSASAGQYQVLAQGGHSTGTQVNWFMNQMLQQYSRFFANWSPKEPARVVVFSNATDFKNYAATAAQATHSGLAGYCRLMTDTGGNTFYELVTYQQDNLWRVLAHEGFHQFLGYELGPQAPIWLNEGLAQYFETSYVLHGQLVTGQISKPMLARAQELLRTHQAPTITELIALDRTAFYDQAAVTYPTAWALAYWLVQRDNKNYHDRVIRETSA